MLPADPRAAAALHTGQAATDARNVSTALSEVRLADGRRVMVKRDDAPGAVRAEKAGLRWLADSGTVRVPTVLGHDACWLVTERIAEGPPTRDAAVELGRSLARLHAAGAPGFGAAPPGGPVDAYIGQAPMRNVTGDSWPEWYVTQRVLPYLRSALDQGIVNSATARLVEQACDRIPEVAGPPQAPARLHGDLWNGNVVWSAEGPAYLIDPAAHGGHRETDLAMLHLFGCPHLSAVLDGYGQIARPSDGWQARIRLHQLFPLLVHTALFGHNYVGRTLDAAHAVLAL
ncbi:fructosamine kinase family protein [Streptomyces sp. NPDC050418]|uniref:fructosamine kinase family protein n=1 Tax=Streptomyces sp. NPDC050418 TaxID=3365612 RepID=UPI0037B5C9F2